MINQQLLDYVKERLQQGATKEQIQSALLNEGWQEQDIDEAFNSLASAVRPAGLNSASRQASDFQLAAKKPSKVLLLVISIIGGLAIAGGGVFAYFYYFPAPEKVLEKMLVKITTIKSLEFFGESNAEIKTGDSASPNISLFSMNKDTKTSINYSGALDIRKVNSPTFSLTFNIETNLLPTIKLAVGADLRVINKVVYIKLSDLPNLGFFDLSVIGDKWIKIDPTVLQNQAGFKQYEEQIKKAQVKQQLSPEQIEKLKTAFKQDKVLNITKLASEKIFGISTHHYKFTIDKTGIKKFFIDVGKIINNQALTEEEIAKFDKGLEALESLSGELWIGKKDFLPYKVTSNLVMKETAESKNSGQINSTLLLKNFNQPVQIEVPAESKTVQEILSGLFGGLKGFSPMGFPGSSLPPANSPGLSGGADADKDGLTDALEEIYGTSPNNPDTDGDGFKDGDEVKDGYNPNGEGKL